VWDASTGAELLQLKGHTGRVWGVAVTPDGARIITASADNSARVWDLAQLRPSPQQRQGQALVDHAKAVVPRCLTIEERQEFLLSPRPPGWCIDTGRYPYDTKHWKAWRQGKMEDAVDPTTAELYGNFADAALKRGDFRNALDAAELSIVFGPELIWLRVNRAHALMFLGRTHDAREEYLAHTGKKLNQGQWEKVIVDDFQSLRESGSEHPLMTEIEQLFKQTAPR
jgi:hypothetical protein